MSLPEDPDEFIKALKTASKEFRKKKRKKQADILDIIISYLPDSPVFAVLEAENLKLTPEFIEVLRKTFDVKQL